MKTEKPKAKAERHGRRETIPWGRPCLGDKERDYLLRALDSTWISGGEFVDRFEADFAKTIGAKHVVAASSGTSALHLALLAAGVGPGDEVIVPGFTFVAPANMTIVTGASPVYVDVDPGTWCIDINEAKKAVTKKTKAIIPVHVYGNVCDMTALKGLAEADGLLLIEDVAEAVFSKYGGKYAGTLGHLGCFSFQATKTITMGEGGAVVTGDAKLGERIRVMRSHGMREDKRYWHDLVGYNYRLTNLQAALGCAQLANMGTIVAAKARIYRRYHANLSGLPGLEFQQIRAKVEPVMWAVAVKIDPRRFKGDRDYLILKLLRRRIETRPGFYPFSVMPLYHAKPLPVAESVSRNVISLPSYVALSDDEIDRVCEQLTSLRK